MGKGVCKNDIIIIYTTMPKEQIVQLIAATIAVSLIKVGAIAGAVLLVKWIAGKITKKKDQTNSNLSA